MTFAYFRRRARLIVRAFKKPVGIKEVRDKIAYQALWTSRLSAVISLIAVTLSAIVAFVAITSLRLNSTAAEQSRLSSQAQIVANERIADAAARQAEASISAARTSQDSLIASQRAWVGPVDAEIVAPVALAPLQATMHFGNTGRQPAPTIAILTPKIFTLEEWSNGTAVTDIEKAKIECLRLAMTDQTARITFPTTGFNTFNLRYDGTKLSVRDVEKLSVSPDLVSGKAVVAFKGCFVYRTFGEIHRTSVCYFYQAKVSDVAHLNFCTVGQAAN
jgi:hypothetical protein